MELRRGELLKMIFRIGIPTVEGPHHTEISSIADTKRCTGASLTSTCKQCTFNATKKILRGGSKSEGGNPMPSPNKTLHAKWSWQLDPLPHLFLCYADFRHERGEWV